MVGQLKAMVGAVGRRVLPVSDVESLFNAKSALQQLEVAVSKVAPKDITKLPSFQRFASNVSDFLVREGSKVKSEGVIVPTPQEARMAIPALVRQLTQAHELTKEVAASLSNGIADYNAVNLPALVAKGVVSRAREVLGAHADMLDAMQPEDRLGYIRSVVLDLLAAKSVVQKFGSSGAFTTFVALSGTGSPYSDATHEADPASLTSTKSAPFIIVEGVTDELKVTPNGGTELTVVMNRSLFAQMRAIRPAGESTGGIGFIIGDGTNPVIVGFTPPDNDELRLRFTDLTGFDTTVVVTLTKSLDGGGYPTAVSPETICADINTALTTASLDLEWKAEPYFFPATFIGSLDISNSVGAIADFASPANTTQDLSFVKVGDIVEISAGPNADLWDVSALVAGGFIAIKRSGTATNELARYTTVGDKHRAIQVRAIAPATMVVKESTVSIVTSSDVDRMGATNLGFSPFSSSFCRPTTAQMLADDLTQKAPTKLSCTRVNVGDELALRTEPGQPLVLVSSKLRTLATVTAGVGTVIVAGMTGLLAAGVVVGDYVVLRGGSPPGTSWLITALTDTFCTATGPGTAISGVGVSVEFGTAPAIARWKAIEILEGPVQGVYHVAGQGTSVLDVALIETVPATQDPVTRTALLAVGTYGTEQVIITSRDTTTASALAVNAASSGVGVLFTVPPATAYGASPWFQLPQSSHAVDTGDQLETHASGYAAPSNTYDIISVDGRILGISPSMPSNASWVFDDQPPPFARVRNGVNLNFTEFKTLLDAWLALSVNLPTYYRDLNRLLNPLLQNASPTADQVGSALNHLELLLEHLLFDESAGVPVDETLEGTLMFYQVDTVTAVDTLIKSFREKGADRAIDLMLQGQFTTFFGMDVHDVSYAGYMQKGIREVVQKDLPIRATKRSDAQQSRLRSTGVTPDFEYSLDDSDNVGVPDIPGDYDDTPR